MELSNGDIAVLKELANGSTYELRNIPFQGRSTVHLGKMVARGLLSYLGRNGFCEYWKITEKGKAVIAPHLVEDANLFLGSVSQRDQGVVSLEAENAALKARIAELEAENISLHERISYALNGGSLI